ncbi:Uncharacterised protein [Serratia quinivorans]|nr:Uncharacterised protein [Serratia quinivorans]
MAVIVFFVVGYVAWVARVMGAQNKKDKADMQAKIDRIWRHIDGEGNDEMDHWGADEWAEYHSKERQYAEVPEFFGYVNENLKKAKAELVAHRGLIELLGGNSSFRFGSRDYIRDEVIRDFIYLDAQALQVVVDTYWLAVVESVMSVGIPERDGWPRPDEERAERLAHDIFRNARITLHREMKEDEAEFMDALKK